MNILFVASYAGTSGANHSLVRMIKILRDEHGVKPFIIVPSVGPLTSMLEEEQLPYQIIKLYSWAEKIEQNHLQSKLKWLIQSRLNKKAEKNIQQLVKEKQIELIHINASTANWGYHTAKVLDIPLVWHIREFMEEDLSKEFRNKKRAHQELKLADKVIAISDSVANKYEGILQSANIIKIYNGIGLEGFDYATSKQIFNGDKIILTMAGRIVPEKGYIEAFEAVNNLNNKGYSVTLHIYGNEGDPIYISQLKKFIESNHLEEVIEFKGYVSNPSDIWLETDIALICSAAEAFGRVTIEAMLGGALVIGANTGATLELISEGQTGFLYGQGDPENLTETIEVALNNKNRARNIAKNSIEYARENYSAERNAENVFALYSNLLNKEEYDE